MERGQDGGAPLHEPEKTREKDDGKKRDERRHEWTAGIQSRKESIEGTAYRKMTARKKDTRMNERSDSCFSFYKRSAALYQQTQRDIITVLKKKGEERSDETDERL